MKTKEAFVLAMLALLTAAGAGAQTPQEVNEANNPLTPKITINLQDQYVGSYSGYLGCRSL